MDITLLRETANKMVAPGKGILAADESHATIGKRFAALDIEAGETTADGKFSLDRAECLGSCGTAPMTQ